MLYVRTYRKKKYVHVLCTYNGIHNNPNRGICGSYCTNTGGCTKTPLAEQLNTLCHSLPIEGIAKKMAPTQANAAFVWRQFIDLGRSNSKKSKRYRCRHCQKDFAATSVGRPKEHLAACEKWQAKQRQERQAQDNAGYLPSYSEAIQKKITEVGIQHISQDESHSYAYDAAAAVIAGGRPFSLFESRRWRYFFTRIKPGWKPPSRAAITRILPDFYQELYDEVFKRITSSEWFNIIFDASDNVSGHRIVNISVQLPDGPAFYWKTFDTGDEQHTAENWVKLIWGGMQQLCGGDLSRINSICTDTENTMRSVHGLLGRFPELSHINFSLCDSHGLQLLIKDILLLPFFEDLCNNVSTLSSSSHGLNYSCKD